MSINFDSLDLEPEADTGIDEQSMPTIEMAPEQESVDPIGDDLARGLALPLMQILPADFRLPALTRFVPDARIKARIDTALAYAKSLVIEGRGPDGITAADAALSELNDAIKAGEQHFEEPAQIAHELHKHVTGTRAAWVNGAKQEARSIGTQVWRESERLKAEAERERRRLQDEANERARQEAEAEAARAKKADAPPQVVQKLEERAKTAVAPPVAPPAPAPVLADNSVVTVWKARLAATPEEAEEIHPEITALSPAEIENVKALLTAIVGGRTDLLAVLSIEWGKLDKLAAAQEKTFSVPGFVSFKTGGTRKKAARGRRG